MIEPRRRFLLGALALTTPAWTSASMAASALAPIRMGYFDSYWPFSRKIGSSSVAGALVDAVNLIGRKAGLPFEHFAYPWARAQLMVERGDLDGFCTVRTQARLAYADFCPTPIVRVSYGIYHRVDDPRPLQVRSVEDLRQFRQATYRGSGYAREHLEIDRMLIDNDEDSILRRLASGDLDTFVEGEYVAAAKINELGLANKIRFTPASFLPKAEFRFGLRRSYTDVKAVLAKVESTIQSVTKSGELGAVFKKYR